MAGEHDKPFTPDELEQILEGLEGPVGSPEDVEWPDAPLCCRCYDSGPLFPATCEEKPEQWLHTGLGMYHCPDCGAMVLAGLPHPDLCDLCLNRKHPSYDLPSSR